MYRAPPGTTSTDPPFPYTSLFRSSWSVTLSNAFGHSRSYANSDGLICTRCVYEALNGTTAASGALSRATNIPLTTENALDVWQPNGGRASDEVLAGLYTNSNSLMHLNRFNQTKLEAQGVLRSEEHTSELQSLMRISYAVFCLKKKKYTESEKERHM